MGNNNKNAKFPRFYQIKFRKLFKLFHRTIDGVKEKDDMRSDYALYTVAIIFFILTATTAFMLYEAESERNLWVVTTAVLGLLFIGLGYSQRPKITRVESLRTPAPTTPATTTKEETIIEATPTVAPLTEVKGIGEKRAEQLKGLGINTIEDLARTSPKELASELRISRKITAKWIGNAKELTEKS
jgi:predicted flap endonuclease-1-like 5' DNA nuclease